MIGLFKFWMLLPIVMMPLGTGRTPDEKSSPRREALAEIYVAPRLQLHVEKGEIVAKDILYCTPNRRKISFGDHTDSFVVFNCENGAELVLDDVLFDLSPKIAIKVVEVHSN